MMNKPIINLGASAIASYSVQDSLITRQAIRKPFLLGGKMKKLSELNAKIEDTLFKLPMWTTCPIVAMLLIAVVVISIKIMGGE